jgi:hypothetical protein
MSETKAKRTLVKEVANGALYSDGTILVKNVRCSYPNVFKPSSFEGSEPAYSIMLLLPKAKSHEAVKKLIDGQIEKVCADAKMKMPLADKRFMRDGDDTDKPETDSCWTISAREKKRPAVRDRDKSVLGSEDADKIYGGCYVNCLIRPWAQNNQYGKRVNANFVAVQFFKDGEPFGQGRISDAEVDDTFDGAEDDDI